MKKNVIYIALFAILSMNLGFVSCGIVEFETSKNGKLDGYWHLQTVDSLANGNVSDVSKSRIFWSVQGDLLETYSPDIVTAVQRCVFHFSHKNGMLKIIEPRVYDRAAGDPLIEDVGILTPFGINSLDESFKVEKLTKGKMTLTSGSLRLYFRKM